MHTRTLRNRFLAAAMTAMLLVSFSTPARAASKEIIELQTQVQQLLDMVQRLQTTLDTRFAVLGSRVLRSLFLGMVGAAAQRNVPFCLKCFADPGRLWCNTSSFWQRELALAFDAPSYQSPMFNLGEF